MARDGTHLGLVIWLILKHRVNGLLDDVAHVVRDECSLLCA